MPESQELRRILGQLRVARRLASIGTYEIDLTAPPQLHWSAEARDLAGWTLDRDPTYEEFIGMIHPDDRPLYLEARASALAGERPYAMDLRFLRPDGVLRRVHFVAEVIRDEQGRPVRLLGVVQDRTEEIDGLRQLRMTEVARRDLLQRLLVTADTERGRLARHLASGPIDALEAIAARLVAGMPPEPLQVWTDALVSVRKAIESLRQTQTEMEAVPTTQGLEEILLDLAAEALPDVQVSIDVDPALSLRPSVQATMLRVVQEALHNVRKHAAASAAEVRWLLDGEWAHVRVRDDGRGFDVDSVRSAAGHLGLVAMRDRLTGLGGHLDIRSEPGCTTVEARLPVT